MMTRIVSVSALIATASCFSPYPLTGTRTRAAHTITQLRMSVSPHSSRRTFLGSAAVLAGSLFAGVEANVAPVTAATSPILPADSDLEIYVGAGCFWHVQHEMTVAEQKLLGRDGRSYTAIAGYAGGSRLGKDGRVCYHNMAFDSDYGSLGHTEVVAVKVPPEAVEGFVRAYVELFNAKGIRHDPQDQGGEYRSAIGLPGGMSNKAVAVLEKLAATKGMKVLPGKGDEEDTLRERSIFVYDTTSFPFHAGELYHQYHNDMTEDYGKTYNALRKSRATEGVLEVSKCPGDAKFVGVLASGDFQF